MSIIIFEDNHMLVVNKPAGWNTHSPGPFLGEGIYEWLKHRESRLEHLAIIHRLDKETSGLVVFGKTSEANRALTAQFTERVIRKTYVFITDRPVPQQPKTTVSALVRAGERYVSRPLAAGAKPAETRFQLIGASADGNLVEARPVTGRTHQIRVHAAQNGFPILGDVLYGGTPARRVFLHAMSISLRHPMTGESMKFQSNPDWNMPDASIENNPIRVRVLPNQCEMVGASLRRAIIDSKFTDSFRCIHGASDGWPGLYVDKLGDWLLVHSEASLTNAQITELKKQVIDCGVRGIYHKALNRRVQAMTTSEASPRLLWGEAAPERFAIRENGLCFEISFQEGYSVGLFLDQRDNRRRFLVNHIAAAFPLFIHGADRMEVMNTFSYTCGFSVASAKAGARTTSVDLSRKYLEWGKRNFALNGIDPAQHNFIYGDTLDWMRRVAKRGQVFDCIVLDPPTFSRSREGGRWQVDKGFGILVTSALSLLRPGGVLLASTNAAKFSAEEFLRDIREAVANARRKVLQQHYSPQPPDFPITSAEPPYLKTAWIRVS